MNEFFRKLAPPTAIDWDIYAKSRGFKSGKKLFTRIVVMVVVLYGFLFYLFSADPLETIVGRKYQSLAPYLIWIAPPILYLVQIWDFRKVLARHLNSKVTIDTETHYSDKRKAQKNSLICACLIAQSFALSEVAAKEDWPHACSAYSNFLEGGEVSDTNDCSGIANFILNNASLKPLEFIKLFSSEAEKGKPLSFLLRAQLEVMYERPQKAFDLLDIADRELYAKTLINGDVERANVYALLLRSLKVQAIQAMCDKRSETCENFVSEPFLEKTLGEKVAWSMDTRSHLLLYCLVRTDAYVVPIRAIFNSVPFYNCMGSKGAKN